MKKIINLVALPFLIASASQKGFAKTNSIKAASAKHQKRNIAYDFDEDAKNALRNAPISASQSFPTVDLANGKASLFGKLTAQSTPFISDKYSKYVVWNVGGSVFPALFGIKDLPFWASFTAQRELTFIRQFDSQADSLIRYWYDPVTKLPLDSTYFDKKEKPKIKNTDGEIQELTERSVEYTIKPGDFIGFRAPISFNVNKNFIKLLSEKLSTQLDVSLNYTFSGEFDIQIFRIDEDHVQVKLLAIQDEVNSFNAGINLVGFNSIGKMVFNRIFNTELLHFFSNDSENDLFTADYIFNLKSTKARTLYDKLFANKMKLLSYNSLSENFEHANPFRSKEKIKELFLEEISQINKFAESEWNQNSKVEDKGILKVRTGRNTTAFRNAGFKLSLLKAFTFTDYSQITDSRIAIMRDFNQDSTETYLLTSLSHNSEYSWIWVYGEKNNFNLDLLVNTKKNSKGDEKAYSLNGVRINRSKYDLALTHDEYSRLENKFSSMLPEPIRNKLVFPKWDFKGKSSINNVQIDQEVYFTSNLFKARKSLMSEENIRSALLGILNNSYKLSAKPYGLNGTERVLERGVKVYHPRMQAYLQQNGNFEKKKIAYEYEIQNIPRVLSNILTNLSANNSPNSTSDEQLELNNQHYTQFKDLVENVPLFREISGFLLLNLTSNQDLDKYIIARLSMTARDQKSEVSYFPKDEKDYDKTKVFRAILGENNFIMDRSYNLLNFYNSDGTIKNVSEIMLNK